MRYTKEIREYVVNKLVIMNLQEFKYMLSQTINDLSKYSQAEYNINQILFYAKVLHYLKYKYNEKESS